MSRYISIVGTSDLAYDDMVNYVDSVVASGIQIQGAGSITVNTVSGITYIDGTDLIAEDNDWVDGGEF